MFVFDRARILFKKINARSGCIFVKIRNVSRDYIGETGRRKVGRTDEHGGKDKQSWIYKHSSTTKHICAKDNGFEILATGYQDRRRRKLAESMFITDLKPFSTNKKKESYKLTLFT